jgi:protease-4
MEDLMKQNILLMLALFLFSTSLCLGQSFSDNLLPDQSVATIDNMLSPVINPAALGFGNSEGFGFMQLWDNKKWQDRYWIFANTEGLSYIYEKTDDRVNTHTIVTGSELTGPYILPNLYGGTAYKWTNNHVKKGGFRSGVMYRPYDYTSFGFSWDNAYRESPVYQFGIGYRPFAQFPALKEHRLELSVDFDYSKNPDGLYEIWQPLIGVNTELMDGVKLGGSYNLENESAMLNFSLSHKNAQVGALSHSKDNNNYGMGYVFLSDNAFLPIAGMKTRQWYTLPIKQQVVTYRASKYSFGPFSVFDDRQTSIESVLAKIKDAAKDPNVSGIVFINKNFAASMALKQEIITEIKLFKATGKKVVFYYDNIGNSDYIFAASIADKIYLNPQGSIDLKGIAINSPYIKDALGKLGIEVMNFRSHPYKTAGNMFSESEMTAQERAEYEQILNSLYAQMCNMIQEGRGKKLSKSVTDVIDSGPYYLAEDALKAGLVDELVYQTQFSERLKKDFKFSGTTAELQDYQTYSWSHNKKTKVAIIYAQGNIVMGKGAVGQKIAQETTVDIIRKARKNDEYKGIILRIDSGGGSAQASGIIHKELELAKTENKKKIVVSMSGVAGSGGYYIACNADYILADPATITGSIGVIGLTFDAERMFKKLYVNWSTVKKGKRSDFGSITRKWTDDEKDIMQKLIAASYQEFVQKVASGRKKGYAEIDSIAMGKIWTGEQALQNGLIDELGGLKEAAVKMKELIKIKGDVELVNVCADKKTLDLTVDMGSLASLFPVVGALKSFEEYVQVYEKWREYGSENTLYVSPLDLEQISGF